MGQTQKLSPTDKSQLLDRAYGWLQRISERGLDANREGSLVDTSKRIPPRFGQVCGAEPRIARVANVRMVPLGSNLHLRETGCPVTRPHPEALYFHIARNALDSIENETDEFRLSQRIGTAIVFSALTLEAFINQEFGLHAETRKIFENEKGIPLRTKWLLLPLLLQSTKTFETGKTPFQNFSELVTIRNTIFHFNPSATVDWLNRRPNQRLFSDLVKDINLSKSYFQVVEEMITKLHQLTGGKTELPDFLHGSEYLTSIWADFPMVTDVLAAVADQSHAGLV
jgi:hypothetical protein